MQQRSIPLVVFFLLWFVAAMALPQHADFPIQTPLDPEATEKAGIGSYHLIRRGEIVAAEAFDVAGETLANCELEWPEETTVMTCTMADGGRFRATWYAERAEFEDLATRDHISLHLETDRPRGAIALEAGEPRPQFSKEWVLRGTKTWAEVERDWGHITPFFGYLLGEVQITLGMIPGDRLFLDRRSHISGQPSNLIICPGGEPFCNSNNPCLVEVLADTPNHCCSQASQDADSCCRLRTGTDCCANTVCQVICPFGLYCDCFLDGWLFDCHVC